MKFQKFKRVCLIILSSILLISCLSFNQPPIITSATELKTIKLDNVTCMVPTYVNYSTLIKGQGWESTLTNINSINNHKKI